MTKGLVFGSQDVRALCKQLRVEGGNRRHACTMKEGHEGQVKNFVRMLVKTKMIVDVSLNRLVGEPSTLLVMPLSKFWRYCSFFLG